MWSAGGPAGRRVVSCRDVSSEESRAVNRNESSKAAAECRAPTWNAKRQPKRLAVSIFDETRWIWWQQKWDAFVGFEVRINYPNLVRYSFFSDRKKATQMEEFIGIHGRILLHESCTMLDSSATAWKLQAGLQLHEWFTTTHILCFPEYHILENSKCGWWVGGCTVNHFLMRYFENTNLEPLQIMFILIIYTQNKKFKSCFNHITRYKLFVLQIFYMQMDISTNLNY